MSLTAEDIARVCHEANRAWCVAGSDFSQLPWDKAPAWQRTSALNGVRYHLAHPNSTPADSHNEWLKEKRATGWKYGLVKDAEAKTHPCFVPYEKLSAFQRAKDRLFLAIVRALEAELPEGVRP